MDDRADDRGSVPGNRAAPETGCAPGAILKNPITGDPILYAPERAGRPHAFGRDDAQVPCPFCPSNESLTPPTIFSVGDPWRIRVFPNKYPAVDGHEVIVESPRHGATFADVDAAEVVRVYIERYRTHAARATYVTLFKNEGERAGASIDHLHSQLMPLPFFPPRVERERAAFNRAASCPLCGKPEAKLIVHENDAFVSFAPAGSAHAYEQWIVPKRHQADIGSVTEFRDLGAILQKASGSAQKIVKPHNVLFMNFPGQWSAHWYIDVFPRMTSIAGFELATGTFIDIIDPVAAARRLR